ncbi:DUF2231 domain-containing protein [uncultured Sphingomonas sp.]|uniref:DUF2231 domain-containing protein n=1 Tax=uncultured Sphingomonas sp. TaxID=158754 RepID=UPI0035CAF4CB
MPDPLDPRPRAAAAIFGRPVLPRLAGFPVAFFTAALATDLAYAGTANLQWQYFSIWLITAGLVAGGLVGAAAIVDRLGDRARWRSGAVGRVLGVTVWVVSFLNAMVHSRDGWTAVVPDGLILSAIVVLLLAVRSWIAGPVVRAGATA